MQRLQKTNFVIRAWNKYTTCIRHMRLISYPIYKFLKDIDRCIFYISKSVNEFTLLSYLRIICLLLFINICAFYTWSLSIEKNVEIYGKNNIFFSSLVFFIRRILYNNTYFSFAHTFMWSSLSILYMPFNCCDWLLQSSKKAFLTRLHNALHLYTL